MSLFNIYKQMVLEGRRDLQKEIIKLENHIKYINKMKNEEMQYYIDINDSEFNDLLRLNINKCNYIGCRNNINKIKTKIKEINQNVCNSINEILTNYKIKINNYKNNINEIEMDVKKLYEKIKCNNIYKKEEIDPIVKKYNADIEELEKMFAPFISDENLSNASVGCFGWALIIITAFSIGSILERRIGMGDSLVATILIIGICPIIYYFIKKYIIQCNIKNSFSELSRRKIFCETELNDKINQINEKYKNIDEKIESEINEKLKYIDSIKSEWHLIENSITDYSKNIIEFS